MGVLKNNLLSMGIMAMLYEKRSHEDKNVKASAGFVRATVAGVFFLVALALVLSFMKKPETADAALQHKVQQEQQAAEQRAVQRFEKEEKAEEQLMKHEHPYDFREGSGEPSSVYLTPQ